MSANDTLVYAPSTVLVAPPATAAGLTDAQVRTIRTGGTVPAAWDNVGETTKPIKFTDKPKIIEANSNQSGRLIDAANAGFETMIESTWRYLSHEKIVSRTQKVKGPKPKFRVALLAPFGENGDTLVIEAKRAFYDGDFQAEFSGEDYTDVDFVIKFATALTTNPNDDWSSRIVTAVVTP